MQQNLPVGQNQPYAIVNGNILKENSKVNLKMNLRTEI